MESQQSLALFCPVCKCGNEPIATINTDRHAPDGQLIKFICTNNWQLNYKT